MSQGRARAVRKLYGATEPAARQREAFVSGEVPVAVYGLGKMGLPLASVYADVTGNVVGADIDPDVVDAINAGDCHVEREPGLDDLVADVVERDALRAVTDPKEAAADASVHVMIVPTLLDDENRPDLSILEAVAEDVAAGLDPGDLVVVECTVPPRTTEDVVAPVLERESDVDPDEYGLAMCPERTASGTALRDIRGQYPKVVGGVDAESTRVAELVYGEITDNEVIPVSDTTTAESVKVFEGLYRDVNIGLANMLAFYADELAIDVQEAIDVANTQPVCDIHSPGPGVGGHCIPVYPYFMVSPFAADSELLEVARRVNDEMPRFTAEWTADALADHGVDVADATVAVFGVTYRPNVKETRFSPSLPVVEALGEMGAEVLAVDPMLDDWDDVAAEPVSVDDVTDRDVDAAVLVTPHDEFTDFDWDALGARVVLDGRRAVEDPPANADVRRFADGRPR